MSFTFDHPAVQCGKQAYLYLMKTVLSLMSRGGEEELLTLLVGSSRRGGEDTFNNILSSKIMFHKGGLYYHP
jgi:hypothetical protein